MAKVFQVKKNVRGEYDVLEIVDTPTAVEGQTVPMPKFRRYATIEKLQAEIAENNAILQKIQESLRAEADSIEAVPPVEI